MNGLNGINSTLKDYFESYEDHDVHKLMLEDKPRTLAYKNAIINSAEKFKDKVVMDIGAGTGILSIFCAKAGARKVYAVEASKLAKTTKEMVVENHCEDIIQVIEKRVEDIEPTSIEKVDIIVSEWMGFYLVHEGMLESVIEARDLFLKEDGLMFPNIAQLYVAPCQMPSFYEFWDDVFGVNMRCVGKEYRQVKCLKPQVIEVNENDLLSNGKLIIWIDLNNVTREEINSFGGEEYVCICKKDGKYQGVCTWFNVQFPDGSELSTAPSAKLTHWKQTTLLLPQAIKVTKDEPIAFKLNIIRDENISTRYNFELIMLDAEEVDHDLPCFCHLTKCIVTRAYIENSEIIQK